MKNRLWPGKPSKLVMWIAAVVVILGAVSIQLVNVGLGHAAGVSGWESPLWPNNGTYPNVISDCNGDGGNAKPDACIFHVTSANDQLGHYTQVSRTASQCGQSSSVTETLTWNGAATTSYSWGNTTTLTSSIGGELLDAVTLGLEQSNSVTNTWTQSQTINSGGSISLTIPAGHKGWITWAPNLHVVHGWLEVHYGLRIYGHFYWYYPSQNSGGIAVSLPKQLPNGQADGRYSSVVVPC